MKNKLMLVVLALTMIAGNSFADSSTLIENKTNARIFYTWKSTNAVLRKARGVVKSNYTSIDKGKSRNDVHLNDLLVIHYPSCKGGKPALVETEYDADKNGYGEKIQILQDKNGAVYIDKYPSDNSK